MQDNHFNKAFIDEAWDQMHEILEKEMPQDKKRRAILWWWLSLPLIFVAISLYSWVHFFSGLNPAPGEIKNFPIEIPKQNKKQTPIQALIPTATPEEKIKDMPDSTPKNFKSINTLNPKNQELSIPGTIPFVSNIPDSAAVPVSNSSLLDGLKAEPQERLTGVAASFFQIEKINSPFPIYLNPPLSALTNDYSKISKKYNIEYWLHGAFQNSLLIQDAYAYNIGLSLQKQVRKFQLGLGLQFRQGQFRTIENSNDESITLNDSSNPGNFDPQLGLPQMEDIMAEANMNVGSNNLLFKYSEINLPIYLGYRFAPHWGLGFRLENTYLLSLKSKSMLLANTSNTLEHTRNQNFTASNQTSEAILNNRFFLEGNIFLNYYLKERWAFQLNYQMGKNKVFQYEDFRWNRNQIGVGISYKLR